MKNLIDFMKMCALAGLVLFMALALTCCIYNQCKFYQQGEYAGGSMSVNDSSYQGPATANWTPNTPISPTIGAPAVGLPGAASAPNPSTVNNP